jgi:hypothetical protein
MDGVETCFYNRKAETDTVVFELSFLESKLLGAALLRHLQKFENNCYDPDSNTSSLAPSVHACDQGSVQEGYFTPTCSRAQIRGSYFASTSQ